MNKLAILGASGHAKVIADLATSCGWDEIYFFDDAFLKNTEYSPPILGDSKDLFNSVANFDGVIVGIGDNHIRLQKQQCIYNAGGQLINIVHPSAIISSSIKLGCGVAIMPNVVVNADCVIGDGCVINTSAIVEHDCILGNAVHIAPGAVLTGGVSIGDLSLIGARSVISPGVSIGNNVIVGAGAVVVKQVKDNSTVVGCPASLI